MARTTPRTDRAGSQPAAGLLIGLGVLAGCGLMAVIPMIGSGSEEAASAGDPDGALATAVDRVSDRVDRLVDQQAEVARRMAGLELAVLAGSSAREPMPLALEAAPEELEEIRESMARFASALETGGGEGQGPVVNQVIEAMQIIEEQERADREAEREQRRQERLDRQLEELTDMLGLDVNQQASMSDLLAKANEARRAVDDEVGSRTERREARDALRVETESKLAGFLGPSQLQVLEDNGGLDLGEGGRGGDRRRRDR